MSGGSSSLSKVDHKFGWRDLYGTFHLFFLFLLSSCFRRTNFSSDIAVKWRQYSEPNDPVWWVDLLSPEQFTEVHREKRTWKGERRRNKRG